MASSSAQILRAARARIADPKNWTTDTFARDANGWPCSARDKNACRWCAYGALRADGYFNDAPATALLSEASQALNCGMLPHAVNDLKGHSAVLKIYDRAIELAEGK